MEVGAKLLGLRVDSGGRPDRLSAADLPGNRTTDAMQELVLMPIRLH